METIAQFQTTDIAKLIEPSAYIDTFDFAASCEEKADVIAYPSATAAFVPLLEANRTKIQEIPRKTFQYGSTDRHQVCSLDFTNGSEPQCHLQLDVYYPIAPSTTGKTQILVWVYGGGFVTGERQLPAPLDLVYATVGSFFARRGFIVIIPDYRLAPSTIFPGAAEDVRDAILWAIQKPHYLTTSTTPGPDTKGIFLMGHSAGAVHAFASILIPPILEAPEVTLPLSNIAGIILHAGVHQWEGFDPSFFFFEVVAQHYGGVEHMNKRSSLGLLRDASAATLAMLPRILIVVAEKEPDWILKINEDFKRELEAITGKKPTSLVALGHNHISPNLALSSGQGERWGEDVIAWIR
ncbi:hypothetical protein C0993_011493 [Termitomyces sp. T159_Od127]|nr:hypothetical protein C0993_011493 [Termitomyces sp. T159_Od127]